MKDITQFDAEFFNYPPVLAERADPQQRMLLEVVYETIVDAGQYKKNKKDTFLVSFLYQKYNTNFAEPNQTKSKKIEPKVVKKDDLPISIKSYLIYNFDNYN